MKKYFSILVLAILLVCGGVTIHSSMICANLYSLFRTNVRAEAGGFLQYSNELPGPQGQRHPQAVQCKPVGWWDTWDIKAGCCYGAEICSRNDCNRSFSCDGKTFL